MNLFGGTRTADGTSGIQSLEQGCYCCAVAGTPGGATVTFQVEFSNSGAWIPVPQTMTYAAARAEGGVFTNATGAVFVMAPSGSRLRALLSGATGATSVEVTLDRTQGWAEFVDG